MRGSMLLCMSCWCNKKRLHVPCAALGTATPVWHCTGLGAHHVSCCAGELARALLQAHPPAWGREEAICQGREPEQLRST